MPLLTFEPKLSADLLPLLDLNDPAAIREYLKHAVNTLRRGPSAASSPTTNTLTTNVSNDALTALTKLIMACAVEDLAENDVKDSISSAFLKISTECLKTLCNGLSSIKDRVRDIIQTRANKDAEMNTHTHSYQADVVTLGAMIESLVDAINEGKASQARRVIRNVK